NRYQDLDEMRQDIAKVRARQFLQYEAAEPRRAALDEGAILIRPGAASADPPLKTPILDDGWRPAMPPPARIAALLQNARMALAVGDSELVFTYCESVLMLDPDNVEAVELSEKAQTIGERAQLQALLADARTSMLHGDFAKAAQLIGEALVIDPT